jgi:hypothetical protein
MADSKCAAQFVAWMVTSGIEIGCREEQLATPRSGAVWDCRRITMVDMRTKTRRALRESGVKLESMTPISLRIPAELWARCDWEAKAQGLDRAEFVRSVLTRATRDTQPPKSIESREIQAPDTDWAEWRRVAERLNGTVDELVIKSVNHVIQQINAKESEE